MAYKYEQVVPWGRSFHEYQRMFHLTREDLGQSILGCADGPASFNAAMARQRRRVVSCDPLYEFAADQIKQRIDATYEDVMEQTRHNRDKFIWDLVTSLDELGRLRLEAMHDFLADYEVGRKEGRYISAALPDLPFAASTFDLALCSHFLFFYSDSLSHEFHQRAVDELCRVAHEVRIFPILTYDAETTAHLAPIVNHLNKAGRVVSIEEVPYEFQRGGNMMMKITSRTV